MSQQIIKFLGNQDGATAIEYGLLAALIAIGAIASFTSLGNGLVALFGTTEQGAGEVLNDATGKV
jgi:pilus assembly protein Flp/PilA